MDEQIQFAADWARMSRSGPPRENTVVLARYVGDPSWIALAYIRGGQWFRWSGGPVSPGSGCLEDATADVPDTWAYPGSIYQVAQE